MGLEVVLGFGFYFLPSLIALLRGARDGAAIIVINLLLGWTVIGWIATLIWSLAGAKRDDAYRRYLSQPMPPVQPLPPGQPYPPYGQYPQQAQYPAQYPQPAQYPAYPPQYTYVTPPNQPTPPPELPIDMAASLKALDGLRAAGLISDAEYQEKRYQILARI
jgi:hypothetical protein